jgi:sugar fermentation stimulation protein A
MNVTHILDLPWDAEATFIERPNRFLCTAVLDDKDKQEVSVHVHDPGRMKELLLSGVRLRLRRASNPNRKTMWDLLAIQLTTGPNRNEWVLTNTGHHRRIMETVLATPPISPFGPVQTITPEYTIDEPDQTDTQHRHAKGKDRGINRKRKRSRLDFVVETMSGDAIAIETKGCTCVIDGVAMFPDAPTERGRRHLKTLMRLKEDGLDGRACRSAVVFLVFHPDAKSFAPHRDIDPDFADLFYEAVDRGIEVHPLLFAYGRDGAIRFRQRLPVQPKSSTNRPDKSSDEVEA